MTGDLSSLPSRTQYSSSSMSEECDNSEPISLMEGPLEIGESTRISSRRFESRLPQDDNSLDLDCEGVRGDPGEIE